MSRASSSQYVNQADGAVRIVLRVPGLWQEPEELALALPEDYELGEFGLCLADGSTVDLVALPPDDEFAEIFARSCDRPPSDADRRKVDQCRVNVCLSGPGGSLESAQRMLKAAAALIEAGGAGVFVDNSGLGHGSDDFLALANDEEDGGVFWAYVITVGNEREIWSLGMHALGYRDAVMPRTGDDDFDHLRINEFLGFTYRSGTHVLEGDLLSGAAGPEFRVQHEAIEEIAEDHPMFNPFGRWRLIPLSRAHRTA